MFHIRLPTLLIVSVSVLFLLFVFIIVCFVYSREHAKIDKNNNIVINHADKFFRIFQRAGEVESVTVRTG